MSLTSFLTRRVCRAMSLSLSVLFSTSVRTMAFHSQRQYLPRPFAIHHLTKSFHNEQRCGRGGCNYTFSTTIQELRLFSTKAHTILDDKKDAATKTANSNTTSKQRDLQKVLQIAEKAAFKAGEIMTQTSGKIAVSSTKMNASDLVTESDLECQRIIKEMIQTEFPLDFFLGEEDVAAGSLASVSALKDALQGESNIMGSKEERLLWIVDPIDGTTNFQAGLPMFCTSIGVVSLNKDSGHNKNLPEVVVGVIYNPILDELACAVRGRGCYVNRKCIQSSVNSGDFSESDKGDQIIPLNQALINVGFPVSSEGTLRASSRAVAALATKVRGLRMIASASQVMSWVAQGKFNAYVSWDLNAWDVAAGMVIVEESGGFVSNFDGSRADISSRDMVVTCNEGKGCSSRSLSGAIRDVLKENDCLKY